MDQLLLKLAECVEDNSEHREIAQIVREILDQEMTDSGQRINNWHPLGFLQLKLGSVPRKGSLKLHIWPPKGRQTQDPPWLIHRHVWSLRSHILSGIVVNNFYKVLPVASKDQATHKIYRVAFSGNFSILEETDEFVACSLDTSSRYVRGQTYDVPLEKFHSTIAPEDTFASTIVLTPPAERDSPDVVGDLDGLDTYEYARVPCDPTFYSQILQVLYTRLSGFD